MKVTVRLFAGLRERAGAGRRELELPEGARLGEVWAALRLGEEPPGLLYAVDKAYADPDTVLVQGAEVALIPPVSGGDFRLSAEPLSLDAVVAEVARDGAGAIATFTGTVRDRSRNRAVIRLEYEAYEGMAEQASVFAVLLTGTMKRLVKTASSARCTIGTTPPLVRKRAWT